MKRAIAYKIPLKLLGGKEFVQGTEWSAGFVEVTPKFKLSRVKVWGNVVNKYRKENDFASLTIDDFSGTIGVNFFKENISLIDDIGTGEVVEIIGRLRTNNYGLYIAVENIAKLGFEDEMLRRAENISTLKQLSSLSSDEEVFEEDTDKFNLEIEKNVIE